MVDCIKGLSEMCRTNVRVEREVGDYFEMKGGLRQVCLMSPWLLIIFVKRLVRRFPPSPPKWHVRRAD